MYIYLYLFRNRMGVSFSFPVLGSYWISGIFRFRLCEFLLRIMVRNVRANGTISITINDNNNTSIGVGSLRVLTFDWFTWFLYLHRYGKICSKWIKVKWRSKHSMKLSKIPIEKSNGKIWRVNIYLRKRNENDIRRIRGNLQEEHSN